MSSSASSSSTSSSASPGPWPQGPAGTPAATASWPEPAISLTSAFYGALAASLVLYVYRFALGGMNVSAFRAVFMAWVAWLALDVVRGRVRFERRLLPFAVVVAALIAVNAVDFLTLGGYPALRRDIANHLVNLGLVGLVLVYVDTDARLRALVKAFVLSSLITTAIMVQAAVTGHVPFERLIRTLGSSLGQSLAYVSDDAEFQRATSSFFDPNFYGVYSLLVVLAIVWLWLYDRPARWLAALFAVNLVCLTLTLSRTAVVGLFAAMLVAFLLERRARLFAVVTVGATVGLLYASTIYQSHTEFDRLTGKAKAYAASWRAAPTPPPAAGPAAAGPAVPAAPPPADSGRPKDRPLYGNAVASDDINLRVANTRSLGTRLEYIRRGLGVFRSSPIWGRGSASLLTPDVQWSSAHVSYLTLLARYGLLGTCAYLAFLLAPAAMVWRRPAATAHRFIVLVPLAALMVVYLSYDILLSFEVQYLLFGIAWATAFNLAARPAATMPAGR